MGDVTKVKITDIDFDRHRVSLSRRAILEEQNAQNEQEVEEENPETFEQPSDNI
jgi:4-hydroxy-3-methylbut-2-enyl diphosphate reductase